MRTLIRLFKYTSKYWYYNIIGTICMVIVSGLSLYWPQIQAKVIDRCLDQRHFELLPYYSALIIGVFLVKGIIFFFQSFFIETTAQMSSYDIRNKLFDHIQRLSFSYHDQAETGQLISRSTADVEAIRALLGPGISNAFVNLLIAIGIIVICFITNWKLAFASLSTMPILVLIVFRYSSKVGPLYNKLQDQIGNITTEIQQTAMGIRVVKAFARGDYQIQKFEKHADELYNRYLTVTKVSAFYTPMMDFAIAAGAVFIIWYGGIQVISHQLTIGKLTAFVTYLTMLAWPIRIMAWVVAIIKNAIASAERVFEVLDTYSEINMPDGTIELKKCEGKVEFQNVSFKYKDGTQALNNIKLTVNQGETIALIGSTGSGKTSLVNLLPRFYDVTSGALLIDGKDIRKYKLVSLRRHIGIVAQETFLFGDTIRQNIAYSHPMVDLNDVIEAAKAANIHDFIMSLPDNYETELGERGVNLSGGQKQRVSIARALLMNPPILILDDSTSSVDTETEALIQEALESLMRSRTTFVISQRIATVQKADRIIVLDKGRIVEIGSHDELIKQNGIYTNIYNTQLVRQ